MKILPLFSILALACVTVRLPAGDTATLCLTNGSLLNGPVIRQTDTNVILLVDGQKQAFSTNQIKWLDVRAGKKVEPLANPQPAAQGSGAKIATRIPMTESELRSQLKSPEGQAMLKRIHDQMIGTETDSRARRASEQYYTTMQDFAEGRIGLAEIQSAAQNMRGQLEKYRPELEKDPQRTRWEGYRDILDQFVQEPTQ